MLGLTRVRLHSSVEVGLQPLLNLAARSCANLLRNGLTAHEIADVLGLKTGSIKLLLFRARRKLVAALQRQVTT